MFLDIIMLVGGLVLVLTGADAMTDGAASVAKRFNISDLVIGLTVVAFGTSAPELTVSILSAVNGSSELAIGNVVGSNIFNILMIVGCTAMVMPIKVEKGIMTKEIPLVILSSIVLMVCTSDLLLGDGNENTVSRADGLILLAFFLIFMRYTVAMARNGCNEQAAVKMMSAWKAALYIIGGIAGLVIGGKLFVEGSCGIARLCGVSESVIGLTLVAGGTSLPELATSIVAAVKKNPGIAIGNVIGSNLFNIFFVLGCSATILPLPMGGITLMDMAVLVGASLLFWITGWFFKKRTITRIEGALMVACYIGYIAYLISMI